MATTVGIERDVVNFLRSLVELEYDAIEAYEAAVARLKDDGDRAAIEVFLSDHHRHVRELSELLSQAGYQAPSGPDLKRVLTTGKVMLGGLVGDRAVLMAMKTNEDDTNTAYERAAGRPDMWPQARPLMERHLADERRHRDWIANRVGEMSHAAE